LGETNNYALFKYIYLMPARTLLYNNLYEEIISCLKENKTFNYEKIKEKENKFIVNIKKEIEISLKNGNNEDIDIKEDDINENKDNYLYKCFDQTIKEFIGFNSDIIPGEIVKEEIELIASTHSFKMFRAVYFTTYFKLDEFKQNLLNHKKTKDENQIGKNIKNNEILSKTFNENTFEENDILEEKNENSIIYSKSKIENKIILENKLLEKNVKYKKNLIRYFISNDTKQNKNIIATFKTYKIPNLIGNNFFIIKKLRSNVQSGNVKNFLNIYRLRDDLTFLNENDITTSIEFF